MWRQQTLNNNYTWIYKNRNLAQINCRIGGLDIVDNPNFVECEMHNRLILFHWFWLHRGGNAMLSPEKCLYIKTRFFNSPSWCKNKPSNQQRKGNNKNSPKVFFLGVLRVSLTWCSCHNFCQRPSHVSHFSSLSQSSCSQNWFPWLF